MSALEEKNIYKTFIISTSVVIALVLSGVFLDTALSTRRLINEDNIIRARTLFNLIVLTRKWNAHYGGVYVEKKPGVESNPYLDNPDIRTKYGRIYTLKNPALMTREISEYAEKEGMFRFHMTSRNPINPHNKPDDFEQGALQVFEKGVEKETFRTERIGNAAYFRYMAPLYVENACLQCHRKQGYRLGEIRGGVSISFDIENIQRKLKWNTLSIALFGLTTTALLLGLINFFTARLMKNLVSARRAIEQLAITDELTGVFNRRHIMARFYEEFEKSARLGANLGVIIADVDNFKAVNDKHGHLVGDEALREIARRIRDSIRIYDILGRYGGEEFLIILPNTDLENAIHLAERIRVRVKQDPITRSTITISLGVGCLRDGDRLIDDILKRADDGLYKAKNAGRDRVG